MSLCANRTFPKVAPHGQGTHDACVEDQVIFLVYRFQGDFLFLFSILYDVI